MPPATRVSAVACARARDRFAFVDIARAAAMFFVLVSHFAFVYFVRSDSTREVMLRIGMVASPTFIIINGILLGMRYRARPEQFHRFRTSIVDRGLFLLTIGHALILLSHVTYAVRFVSITDTVGVCMVISPWLVPCVRARDRLIASVVLYAASVAVYLNWHPAGHYAMELKEAFFGAAEGGIFAYAFPIVPWFSFQLAVTVLGERLGALTESGDTRAMHRLLLRTAGASVALAAILNVSYHLAVMAGARTALATHALASPFAKTPPSLVYLLFYGSLGLIVISMCLRVATSARMLFIAIPMTALGQTSFAIFVAQFFVYFTVLPLIRDSLPWGSVWPVYFTATIAAIVIPVMPWYRAGCNRFLTVGYARLVAELGNRRPAIGGIPAPQSR